MNVGAIMLEFASPGWLWVGLALAAAGAWGLWRGQRQGRAVSSVKLWSGLAGGETARQRRAVDPLWLLVWLATVLGAVCLARPMWTTEPVHDVPRVSVEWSVQELKAGELGRIVAAFVRVEKTDGLHDPALLVTRTHNAVGTETVPLVKLREGWLSALSDDIRSVTLELHNGQTGEALAIQTFARPARRLFGVRELGPIPEPLRRVFAVQPGAVANDPTVRPVVLLAGELPARHEAGAGDLVIAGPDVAAPGLELGARVLADNGEWAVERADGMAEVGPNVSWDRVHVTALREAHFSDAWRLVAQAGGRPFVAVRPGTADSPTWVWLAADVGRETDWWKDPGFVVFFAQLSHEVLSRADPERLVAWQATGPLGGQAAATPHPPAASLTPVAGALAIAMLASAAGWQLFRGRRTVL
jgi:hypothetical protein